MRRVVIGCIAIMAAVLLVLLINHSLSVSETETSFTVAPSRQKLMEFLSVTWGLIVLLLLLVLSTFFFRKTQSSSFVSPLKLFRTSDSVTDNPPNTEVLDQYSSTILNTTNTIYFLLNKQLEIIAFNKRAIEFCQAELHNNIDYFEKNLMTVLNPEQVPVLKEWMEQRQPGNYVSYETSYVQKDQSVHWYLVKMFPVMKIGQSSTGVMLEITDHTSQKMMEQEILDKEVQDQKTVVREVLKAQENERNKIGQELHDNVNQILASTKLYLHMAYTDHPNNIEFIKTSMDFLDEAVSEIRKLSSKEVTPMKEIHLTELINASLGSIQQHSGIRTSFTYKVSNTLLIDEDLKLNLYRIVQEQLNNILRHARASSLTVSMEELNGCIALTISDNGRGFDPAKDRKGIGISNMINRVTSYNGEIDIKSLPGNGCTVSIKIPIQVATNQYRSLLHG